MLILDEGSLRFLKMGSFRFFTWLSGLHFCVFDVISRFFRFWKWLRFGKRSPMESSVRSPKDWRTADSVQRLAYSVQRTAYSVQRLAYSVQRTLTTAALWNHFHTGRYYTTIWVKKRGKLFFCLRETQRLKRVLFSRSSLRPLWQVFLRQCKFFWGVKFCQKMYLTPLIIPL